MSLMSIVKRVFFSTVLEQLQAACQVRKLRIFNQRTYYGQEILFGDAAK